MFPQAAALEDLDKVIEQLESGEISVPDNDLLVCTLPCQNETALRAAPPGCLPPPELARYLASISEKSHNLTEVRVHMANPEEDLAYTQIFVTARNAWLVESFGSGPRSSLMAMSHGAGSAKNSSMDRQQI